MSRRTTAQQPLDERLGELLAVERRLDALVEQAKADAQRWLDDARRDGERARQLAQQREQEQARREEAEDVAAFEQALAQLEAQHAQTMAWLAAVPEALVERLARVAVASAVRGEAQPAGAAEDDGGGDR